MCKCCGAPDLLLVILLVLALWDASASAQEKIAEGEYEMVEPSAQSSPSAKTATRWMLYRGSSGGYRLNSEIQNTPKGLRVLQVEQLNDSLSPTSIGYELYLNDEKKPGITVRCDFSKGSIVCDGRIGERQVGPSEPYSYKGPFWLWIRDLAVLDMPWLINGAVNMSQVKAGKAIVEAITVSGGTASPLAEAVTLARLQAVKTPDTKITVPGTRDTKWVFETDEEDTLEFVGAETIEINGTKIGVIHYRFQSGDQIQNLWITTSGILVKLSGGQENGEFVLANFRQYKKLIPELPIESRTTASPRSSK